MVQPGADTAEIKYCRDNADLDLLAFCHSFPTQRWASVLSRRVGSRFQTEGELLISLVKTVPLNKAAPTCFTQVKCLHRCVAAFWAMSTFCTATSRLSQNNVRSQERVKRTELHEQLTTSSLINKRPSLRL